MNEKVPDTLFSAAYAGCGRADDGLAMRTRRSTYYMRCVEGAVSRNSSHKSIKNRRYDTPVI